MTYEIAKELKDAGFPQTGISNRWPSNGPTPEDQVYAPTLEELIEACVTLRQEQFGLYQRDYGEAHGQWVAEVKKGRSIERWELGTTPTEAVASLWLALNRKP